MAREKDAAVKAAEYEIALRNQFLRLGGMILLIISAFLLYFIRLYAKEHKENSYLSHQLTEAYARTGRSIIQAKGEKPEAVNAAEMEASELYEFLSSEIIKHNLYLNPNFGRQNLIDTYSLTRDQIGRAFSSQGTSLPAFINKCRLDYSTRLLKLQPAKSIAEIAASSGFTTRESFGRNFKQQFGVTPGEYRQSE